MMSAPVHSVGRRDDRAAESTPWGKTITDPREADHMAAMGEQRSTPADQPGQKALDETVLRPTATAGSLRCRHYYEKNICLHATAKRGQTRGVVPKATNGINQWRGTQKLMPNLKVS